MNEFEKSLLTSLSLAIFERVGPGEYVQFNTPPPFYRDIFPDDPDGSPCRKPWEYSEMLKYFFEDMENMVLSTSAEKISTGIWQEDGLTEDTAFLLANGFQQDGRVLFILRNMANDFPSHVRMLQKARENMLTQQTLNRSLDFYKQRSSYDSLTTLYNRGTFFGLMEKEIRNSLFSYQPLALLMLDLDDFKLVNDTYGHLAGDRVLKNIGIAFKEILRSSDIAARYGGEEFIICTMGTNLKQAEQFAEKVRLAIAGYDFSPLPSMTASIGITMLHEQDTVESCIERADAALYEAKRTGKNKVCIALQK